MRLPVQILDRKITIDGNKSHHYEFILSEREIAKQAHGIQS